MEQLRKKFEFDSSISGQSPMDYMSSLLEKNEKQEIEIERGKLAVSVLKQMHNRNRLLIDAAKYEIKMAEFKLKKENLDSAEK